ncbi:hypothetical protein BC830DRAFT_1063810 [Chytriomyces sp. MP71]|nr:hypothetical protein BC830DRAFT_1063810 [Chytriomyces sp. MP71]
MPPPPTVSKPKLSPIGAGAGAVLRLPWKAGLQRLPGVWLLLVAALTVLGPAHAPHLFALYFVLVHLISSLGSARIAYGAYHAKRMAAIHSYTDWAAEYCKHSGLATNDPRAEIPFDELCHVIIIPNYKENMDTLCETLDILASHSRAISQYKICLAMEAGEKESEEKAMTLVSRYIDCFLQIVYTIHPRGLEGETAGKHSNVSWAARQMTKKSKNLKMDIITCMDADTAFAEDYFSSVAFYYATAPKDQRMLNLYAPSTVFDRNSKDVPIFVRLSDTLWSAGVMGNYVSFSPITIPCSAYSMPMELVQAVDFWDVGPEGLGEDMHMFLKCFFATEGRLKVTPIFSPASCCNIEGPPGSGVYGFMHARYVQGKRHMWGALDYGYALHRALECILAPGHFGPVVGRNPTSDAKTKGVSDNDMQFNLYRLLILMHRLTEAHIAGGHMFLMIALSGLLIPASPTPTDLQIHFWQAITSQAVHPIVLLAVDICGWIRLAAVVNVFFLAYNYEQYHQWVGVTRWALSLAGDSQPLTNEQTQQVNGVSVGIGKRVQHLGRRAELMTARTTRHCLDWFGLPVTGLLYQAIPSFHVQILQLWTDKLTYEVAAKPTLKGHPAAHPVPEEPGVVHVFGGHERLPGEKVPIPELSFQEVETLVDPSVEHGPDEILVLKGLQAHRFEEANARSIHMQQQQRLSQHSHTSSFSSSTDFVSDVSSAPTSFPTSPRMNFMMPPPPYTQSIHTLSSPPLKVVDRTYSQPSMFDSGLKEEYSSWEEHDVDEVIA